MECNHVPQKSTDEIVIKEKSGIIINSGYICSKCNKPVFMFEDLI